jgi:hypothetical protein
MKRPLPFLVLSLFLIASHGLHAEVISDKWMSLFIDKDKIGYQNTRIESSFSDEEPVYITTSVQQMSVSRMGTTLVMKNTSRVVENAQGRVRSFTITQQEGDTVTKSYEGRVDADHITIKTPSETFHYDYPTNEVMGPYAFEQKVKQSGFGEGQKVYGTVFDELAPDKPATIKISFEGMETKDVNGAKVSLRKASIIKPSLAGIIISSWYDEKGDAQISEAPMGGMGKMVLVSAPNEQIAQSNIRVKEMMSASLIKPDREFTEPTDLERAKFRISSSNTSSPLRFENDAQQTSRKITDQRVYLTVADPPVPKKEKRFAFAPAPSKELLPYLEASPVLQTKDVEVVKIAKQISGSDRDPLLLAKRIELALNIKIQKKNLSKGFLTAADVARTMEGDCTEHAVLAAAVARSLGIPSRVVAGLAYVASKKDKQGAWGFHLWTEVMIAPNTWYPIDPTLGQFDVGHIAFSRDSLYSISPSEEMISSIINSMGSLKIDVVEETPVGGKTIRKVSRPKLRI